MLLGILISRNSLFYPNDKEKKDISCIYIQNVKTDFKNQKYFESPYIFRKCVSAGYLSSDKGGKIIALLIAGANERVVNKKFLSIAESRMTKILIALKFYKLERGDLPESLDQLIPDYFLEIPEDPYGGKPLRYSKEKKVVYSGYENLLDDDGDIQEQVEPKGSKPIVITDETDLTIKIEFL